MQDNDKILDELKNTQVSAPKKPRRAVDEITDRGALTSEGFQALSGRNPREKQVKDNTVTGFRLG